MIRGLFGNWRFRSARPSFAAGEEIRAYLTGFDAATGQGTVRVGDTVLVVEGAAAAQLDTLVNIRVESFDASTSAGRGRLLLG